ncbi:MAG: ribosome biogenesis GTP-binding protein YihA/YsxC [Rickettsiales bacterium]|jgi:GTP-binding protein|nr:ribosome biogenesis GTP-binding protein YihA/YsxC [Rickettsiales bacterium]
MKIRDFFKIRPAFVGSFVRADGMPRARVPEIAFAGRSNVGKSSLINALWNAPGLAKTSSTPGRTQAINLFDAGGRLRVADLPGYGFAKAPRAAAEEWSANARDYFATRAQLRRVFLLVDSRHGPKPSDLDTMDMLDEYAVPYQIVLTKCDKAKEPAARAEFSGTHPAMMPAAIATSSESGAGLDELRREIFSISIG